MENLNIQTADEALNHQEVETETPEVETETTENQNPQEKKEVNKDFYKVLWQKKQLEKELQEIKARKQQIEEQRSNEEDLGEYDPDDLAFIEKRAEKIAEKKFNELHNQKEQQVLQLKEEQAFLANHPEAIEKLDAVKRYRDTIDPEMSLKSAWRLLAPAYWYEPQEAPKQQPNLWGNWSIQKATETKDDYKDWENFIGKGT